MDENNIRKVSLRELNEMIDNIEDEIIIEVIFENEED